MKSVRCNSGLIGSQELLQKRYSSFEEFKSYCRLYNIHKRLGYVSMEGCWTSNPTIQSSSEPSDLKRIYFHAVKKKDGTFKVKESTNKFCKDEGSNASFGNKKATKDWINSQI